MQNSEQYSIVYPKGFKASGIHSKIKKRKKDLAVIYSEAPCTASGTFTKNVVKAAPVILAPAFLRRTRHGDPQIGGGFAAGPCGADGRFVDPGLRSG